MSFSETLKEKIENYGLAIDEATLSQFEIYSKELKDWNTRINLTSLTDDSDIIEKHFIDSLLLFRYKLVNESDRIIDVGTGAGFPGIPIKIYRPDIRLSLLESIGKKAKFLSHVINKLQLGNADVINDRAEVVANRPEYRESYDIVVARCVARLPILAEYCLPLVSVGGEFVAYKGQESETEIKEAKNAIEKLGGRLTRVEYSEAHPERRALIFFDKIKKTPEQYPRQPGMAKKKPL